MIVSCVVCNRPLPSWHLTAPSFVDYCSLECLAASGATMDETAAFKALLEKHRESRAPTVTPPAPVVPSPDPVTVDHPRGRQSDGLADRILKGKRR